MKSLTLFTLLQKTVSDLNNLAGQLRDEKMETHDVKNKTIEIIDKAQEQLKE